MSKKLMVALAVCALMATGSAMAVQAGYVIYDMHFTGYGDGVHFWIDTTWGIVTGNYTGADDEPLVGIRCALVKEGNVQAIVWRDVYARLHVIRANYTWSYYNMNGTLYSSGTWHWGTPASIAADGSALKKTND